MTTQAKTVQTANPTVDIAINKSRIKRYNKDSKVPTFYMNDGQEFQLELFNPTSDIIAAEIFLNNKRLEGGKLVLKPGQRVFLDRYLDSPRKFKFETYEVGTSKAVEQAIMYNGVVDVRFYKQLMQYVPAWNNPTWTYYNTTPDYTINTTPINDWYTTSGTSNLTNTGANTFTTTGMTNVNYSQGPIGNDGNIGVRGVQKKSKKKETGTIGKGRVSDQEFKNVEYNFEFSDFHRIQYQILPLSEKVVTTDDLNVRRYCVQCGTKQKPNFKFCPSCGAKQ